MRGISPILQHLHVTRQKFLAAIESVPDRRWHEPPRPGAWSAAEVVAHVTLIERAVNKNVSRAVGAPPTSVPVWKRLHLPVWIATWRLVRVKTAIPIKAELICDKNELISSLIAARKLTTGFLEANCDRDLGQYRAPHPFLGNLNLYEWIHFIAYHEERHRKQIREIVDTFQV